MKFFILTIFISTATLAGDASVLLTNLATNKLELEKSILTVPYRNPEHLVIKNYFESLKEETAALAKEPKRLKRLNTYLLTLDPATLCSDLFIDQGSWETVVKNCTKNRFFLCSEEVKNYSELKSSFQSVLNNENQGRFKATPECQ